MQTLIVYKTRAYNFRVLLEQKKCAIQGASYINFNPLVAITNGKDKRCPDKAYLYDDIVNVLYTFTVWSVDVTEIIVHACSLSLFSIF